jgi:chemotaxis protein histidine kinase CheA
MMAIVSNKDTKNPGMPDIDPEILARAERAVAALGDEFVARVGNELPEYRALVKQSGFETNDKSLKSIFTFAHDLRGQGGSFGYPLLSEIGTSLCKFVETREHRLAAGDTIVFSAHIDVASAIIANGMAGEGDAVARTLVDSLASLVQKRLKEQS